MNLLSECHLFHQTLIFDDRSKKSRCKNIKFKRAFQFLQTLLLQRVYGIDVLTRPLTRRTASKHKFEVFLGGSCNPTTWRCEQAIPYYQSHSISCYNPQVANWTPDLIQIECQAKEEASLLFFVIDHNTRSLAAIAEVCYLAACGRKIIVVMNSMPDDKNQTKFIREKNSSNKNDDEYDYENVREARRLLRVLLQVISIPIFDNVRTALECSTFVLENTKQNGISFNHFHDNREIIHSSSSSLSPFLRSVHFTTGVHFHRIPICTKTQISCTTNESDDDGYASVESSNRTLSRSSSSISSDFNECSSDHQHENSSSR
jgi:predicted small lipoprotein YifL